MNEQENTIDHLQACEYQRDECTTVIEIVKTIKLIPSSKWHTVLNRVAEVLEQQAQPKAAPQRRLNRLPR